MRILESNSQRLHDAKRRGNVMFPTGMLYKLRATTAVWIDSSILETRCRDYWLQAGDMLYILDFRKNHYVVQARIGVFITTHQWLQAGKIQRIA